MLSKNLLSIDTVKNSTKFVRSLNSHYFLLPFFLVSVNFMAIIDEKMKLVSRLDAAYGTYIFFGAAMPNNANDSFKTMATQRQKANRDALWVSSTNTLLCA